VGGAATATLLDSRLAFHVNVDGSFRDNTQALHYRVGTSVVPIATNVILLRPFAYLDGRAFIRDASGGDLRVAAGAQALLFDFLTLQAGFDYRFLDDSEPSKNSTDKGTWAFDIGAGVAF
jgi:hypothetical protein